MLKWSAFGLTNTTKLKTNGRGPMWQSWDFVNTKPICKRPPSFAIFSPTQFRKKSFTKNLSPSEKALIDWNKKRTPVKKLISLSPSMITRFHGSEIPNYGKILARNTIWVFIKLKKMWFFLLYVYFISHSLVFLISMQHMTASLYYNKVIKN